MKYLLDTCVVAELIRPAPDKAVVRWLQSQDERNLYLSVLTIGEISKGIEKVADVQRKKKLHLWLTDDLGSRFHRKVLPVNEQVAMTWGQVQGRAECHGRTMPTIDGLIAATGLVFDMIVVTRNISDMEESGVALLNPWVEK